MRMTVPSSMNIHRMQLRILHLADHSNNSHCANIEAMHLTRWVHLLDHTSAYGHSMFEIPVSAASTAPRVVFFMFMSTILHRHYILHVDVCNSFPVLGRLSCTGVYEHCCRVGLAAVQVLLLAHPTVLPEIYHPEATLIHSRNFGEHYDAPQRHPH